MRQPVEIEEDQQTDNKQSKHKSIYRQLAKKLHPDSLPEGDERYDEYEKAFQVELQRLIATEHGAIYLILLSIMILILEITVLFAIHL